MRHLVSRGPILSTLRLSKYALKFLIVIYGPMSVPSLFFYHILGFVSIRLDQLSKRVTDALPREPIGKRVRPDQLEVGVYGWPLAFQLQPTMWVISSGSRCGTAGK